MSDETILERKSRWLAGGISNDEIIGELLDEIESLKKFKEVSRVPSFITQSTFVINNNAHS